jgi:hypothetical protein
MKLRVKFGFLVDLSLNFFQSILSTVGYSPNTTSEALLTTNALLDSKKNPVLGCPHHFHVFPTFRMPLSNWVYAVALQIRELLKVRLDMRPKQKQNEKRQNKTEKCTRSYCRIILPLVGVKLLGSSTPPTGPTRELLIMGNWTMSLTLDEFSSRACLVATGSISYLAPQGSSQASCMVVSSFLLVTRSSGQDHGTRYCEHA